MDVPADQSTPMNAPLVHSTLREAIRSPRRRRPTGAPPPLPYRLQTSGVGWLVALVVLVGLELAVFARGLRGAAVAVTVADDAVGRWLGGLHAPGLEALLQGLAHVGSWWTLMALWIGLLLALILLRRWRHLIVWLVAWELGGLVTDVVVARTAQRPRPFGVDLRTSWGGWAMPSLQITIMTAIFMGILYTLVPEGRWRNTGKRAAAVLVALVGVARIALGTDAPSDVLLAVGIGVAIPLLAFRLFAPSEVFPVVYKRGRSAHLDVGGARGVAIRRGLQGRLGRLHTAADHRQGRPAQAAVRQALRQGPPARRPLVQARAGAAVRPAGGREAVQHGAAAGAAGGLRAVADAARRAAEPHPLWVCGVDPRAGVPAGHRVLPGCDRARRRRGRRAGHRRRPGDHPPAVGRGSGPPRHQAGQPAGPRRPPAADRRGLRGGPPEPVAAGGRPGQHDAVPGTAQRCRAGLPAGAAPVQRGRDQRGVRGGPWAGVAVPASPDAAGEGPRPARRVHPAAPHAAAADPGPAVERSPDRPVGGDRAPGGPCRSEPDGRTRQPGGRQDPAQHQQSGLHPAGAAVARGPVGAVSVDGAVRAVPAARLEGRGRGRQQRPVGHHPGPRPGRQACGHRAADRLVRPNRRGRGGGGGAGHAPLGASRAPCRRDFG